MCVYMWYVCISACGMCVRACGICVYMHVVCVYVHVVCVKLSLFQDEHKLSLAPDDDKELFAYKPESKLIRWKYATLAEVQVRCGRVCLTFLHSVKSNSFLSPSPPPPPLPVQGTTQFARLSVFSLQERTNRFFVATLQTEKGM